MALSLAAGYGAVTAFQSGSTAATCVLNNNHVLLWLDGSLAPDVTGSPSTWMQMDKTIILVYWSTLPLPSAGRYESENNFVLILFCIDFFLWCARSEQASYSDWLHGPWLCLYWIKVPVLKTKLFCHPLSKFKHKACSVVNMQLTLMFCLGLL